ncbi:hypothetical protein KAI87_14645 [Myxococcota bacterium]|nr:hypothetical protein [Myxococcota bacterium]
MSASLLKPVLGALLLGSLFFVSGCSKDALDAGSSACSLNAQTLEVSPSDLVAGQDTKITVSWVLSELLDSPPQIQLMMGQGDELSVTISLETTSDSYDSYPYFAEFQNPFGLGLDAGYITVIAEAPVAPGCPEVSATTSIELLAAQ